MPIVLFFWILGRNERLAAIATHNVNVGAARTAIAEQNIKYLSQMKAQWLDAQLVIEAEFLNRELRIHNYASL